MSAHNGAQSATQLLEHDHAGETPGASRIEASARRAEHVFADIARGALHILAERAYLWVTLTLTACAWGFVLYAIVFVPRIPYTPLIIGAWLFTCLTHVPTWTLWKKGR